MRGLQRQTDMFSFMDDLRWETNKTLHDVVRIGDITTPWVGEATWHRRPVLPHLWGVAEPQSITTPTACDSSVQAKDFQRWRREINRGASGSDTGKWCDAPRGFHCQEGNTAKRSLFEWVGHPCQGHLCIPQPRFLGGLGLVSSLVSSYLGRFPSYSIF